MRALDLGFKFLLPAVVASFGLALAGDEPVPLEPDRFLADLPADILDAISRRESPLPDSPTERLQGIFESCVPYEFDVGTVVALTDPRWFTSLPPSGVGAPLLLLRRWPGDTVVAIYAVEGPLDGEGGSPPIAGGSFALVPGANEVWAEWQGRIRTGAGEIHARWVERRIADAPAYMGTLILPGDAGLGPGAVPEMLAEARAVMARIQVRYRNWKLEPTLPRGGSILVPELAGTTGADDESEAPWQVVRASGFTIGLPPGVRARRTDGSVPPPVEMPGGRLWFRGSYTDTTGERVVIGDRGRFGYVALIEDSAKDWISGERPPLGAPGATRKAAGGYPLLVERAGADVGRAERWKVAGESVHWLVFRLKFEGQGIEIAYPVLVGRESPSLYWIPATWRAANLPPAPPPVDPAERFGIKFEQLTSSGRKSQPWMEGYLSAPGIRAELPTDWWPSASLRSVAGYPIRFLEGSRARGLLTRLTADQSPLLAEEAADWSVEQRPKIHRALRVHRRSDDSFLFVAREGHAFLFQSTDVDDAREAWLRMIKSVQLLRTDD